MKIWDGGKEKGGMMAAEEQQLRAAVADYHAQTERGLGLDWASLVPSSTARMESRVPSRNEALLRAAKQVSSMDDQRLAATLGAGASPPFKKAVVLSGYVSMVEALLSHGRAEAVTWYCLGPPTSMTKAAEAVRRHAPRLEVRVTSAVIGTAFSSPTESEALRGVDAVFGDFGDYEADHAALQLCTLADLLGAVAAPHLVVFGRVPDGSASSARLAEAWDILFRAGEVLAAEPYQSVGRQLPFWTVRIRAAAGGPDLARARAVRRACIERGKGGTGPPVVGDELLRHAAKTFAGAAEFLRKAYANLGSLPRGRRHWRLKREEPPYVPGLVANVTLGGRSNEPMVRPKTYQREGRDFRPVCHWGQLKLLLSEVEFLTGCARAGCTDGSVVIYAGASPGDHIDQLIEMFPAVRKWILFDGARSKVRSEKAEIHGPGASGFVTDDTVRSLRRRLLAEGDPPVLFVSDIRTAPVREAAVAREMRDQARWGVHLRARAMLLKLRPPYVETDGSFHDDRTSAAALAMDPADLALLGTPPKTAAIGDAPCFWGTVAAGEGVLYLHGRVQMQVFAPPTSTEARLVVIPDSEGKYALARIDPVAYEACMSDFNDNLRTRGDLHLLELPDSEGLTVISGAPLPPGHDRSWECMRFARVMRDYLELGSKRPSDADVARAMRALEERLSENVTLLGCVAATHRSRGGAPDKGDAGEREILAFWERVNQLRLADHSHVARVRLLADRAAAEAAYGGRPAVDRMIEQLGGLGGPTALVTEKWDRCCKSLSKPKGGARPCRSTSRSRTPSSPRRRSREPSGSGCSSGRKTRHPTAASATSES